MQLGTTTKLTIGASSIASAPLTSSVIRVVATSACHIIIGSGPVATTDHAYLPANVVEYFEIGDTVGDSTLSQIAVIQNSGSGVLYITEMV